MDSLQSQICKLAAVTKTLIGEIVRQFQDMAVAYGYVMLRDFRQKTELKTPFWKRIAASQS